MAETARTPIDLIHGVYDRLTERVAAGRRAPRPSPHLRREDPGQPPRRPRRAELERGTVLHRPPARPGRHAGRHRPDGAAPVHDRRPRRGRGARRPSTATTSSRPGSTPRSTCWPRSRATTRSTTSSSRSRPVRHRLLEAGLGDHPPGRARAVRLPRRDDDRHRQPHAQRRRPRHGRHRRRRRRRRRRHDRLPVQRALAQAHRRPPDRRAQRLVGLQGRHPEGRRDPHREGRHRRHRRVLRARRRRPSRATGKATICNMGAEIGATTSLFAYDDAMARYLKATGREDIADAGRRRRRTTCGPTTRSSPIPAATSTRSSRSTSTTLRPLINGPHTPDRARTGRRPGRRGRGRGLAAGDQLRAGRLVHELLLRGHHPGRLDRPPRRRPTASRAKTDLMITPGSEQVRATIERDGLLADFEAHRGHRAGQRLRPVHRPVGPVATWTRATST